MRFVDPALERAYRDAMTIPTRRRFRIAAVAGIAAMAWMPVELPVLGWGELGPTFALAVIAIVTLVAAAVWAGRVGLRGIWILVFAESVPYSFVQVAMSRDVFIPTAALCLVALGIVVIAWIRVAWWVGVAATVGAVLLYVSAAVALGADGPSAFQQTYLLALTLGCATAGSWFLESAERRAFAQGLLVDHLYHRVDRLFRSYLSPDVAETLVADPARAELGGEIVEVSVLFADLRGYTPFAEDRSPAEVAMLNTAFGSAVPAVFAEGGTIVSFVGDALMAIFNAPLRQPDHALRACRAGLALQAAVAGAAASSERPRFRVGINTGPALVGNIGSADLRNFSALGDTTNTASRLQTCAPDGSVVIGERTYERVREAAAVRALGRLDLKGKSAPTAVYELVGLRAQAIEPADRGPEPGAPVFTGPSPL